MVKILHLSDFHLGSDFRALGRKAPARRTDLRETFLDIINICRDEKIQLLLAAGDIFENWNISEEIFEMVAEGFAAIPNTKVVIAAGNHDPLTPDSAYLREGFWPDNVIILPEEFSNVVLDELEVEIWGAGFKTPYTQRPLLGKATPEKPEYIQVGVIHGSLGSSRQESQYNPISGADIAGSGLDYLALGHIHKPTDILKEGGTHYAYPGCPEGRGFDELGEHGVLVGTLSKRRADLKLVPVCQRMHLEDYVDITGSSGSRGAADMILQQLEDSYGSDYENHLYKIYLEGKVRDSVNISLETIKGYLKNLFYVKLRDKTQLDIDLELVAQELSLKGVFVRNMLAGLENSDAPEAQEALKLGLKAFFREVEFSED